MIAFGLQGMFPCWRKRLHFYWKKAFERRVLTICGKVDYLLKITLSPHLHNMRNLTLMKKLTIR
jgi:hypothetical protein